MYAHPRNRMPTLPKKVRTRPIDFGRSWSSAKRSPTFFTNGTGRYGASALLTAIGPAPAVRAGDLLVDVVRLVAPPEAARRGDPGVGVHVRPVEIAHPAGRVHQVRNRLDLPFEQPEGVRVGDHEHRRVVAEPGLQV